MKIRALTYALALSAGLASISSNNAALPMFLDYARKPPPPRVSFARRWPLLMQAGQVTGITVPKSWRQSCITPPL